MIEQTDPITDQVSTVFMTTSTNTVPNSIGVPIRVQLVLRCSGREFTDIYVVTGGYVGDEVRVQYRLDGGTPSEEIWAGGRAKDALFYQAPRLAPSLLWVTAVAILVHKNLVFRWLPPMEDARTAFFTVSGFDLLPQKSLRACGRDKETLAIRGGEREKERLAQARKAAFVASLQSSDGSLPWAGKLDGILYWKNAPDCWHNQVARDKSEWVYFRQEQDAVALQRTRSNEAGC